MARSDLLLALVKAGRVGDQASFRHAVESLIAEERAKHHDVLANRLAEEISKNGTPLNGIARAPSFAPHELFVEIHPKRTVADLVLPESVEAVCREIVEEHHRAELLRSHGLTPRHRLLLIGPPGNGKTTLAEALAHALMVPMVVVRYDALIASYLGETALRLRKLFDYVRTRSCLLFFDEFDTIGKERGDEHETGEIKRVVSSLLMQVDELPPHVVLVTATNHPELLDTAAWRRFQVRMELPFPGPSEIERYFERFQQVASISLSCSAKTLATKLAGASFSQLEDFLADVARRIVLSQAEADPKRIVKELLQRWQAQLRIRPQS
jgi:SpoVK/Ycf46/Vps4 family AAA+-type ATPase